MSILMRLAFGSKGAKRTFTQTFTANGTWVCPAGVSVADISGYGARGTNSSSVPRYNRFRVGYYTKRSGGTDVIRENPDIFSGGPPPPDYCDAPISIGPENPTYSSVQFCYEFRDASGFIPATTGASSTFTPAAGGTARAFPGSTGNVQPATTTILNIPVTQGATYNIVIPTGGSITLTWKA